MKKMEEIMKNRIWVFAFLLTLVGCTTTIEDNASLTGTGGDSAVKQFESPYSYSNITEGIYTGGALVYNPGDPSINQLKAGMTIRFRLDKYNPNATNQSDYQFGVLIIRSIEKSGVLIDYILFDKDGNASFARSGVNIPVGQNISLNGDENPDLGFFTAAAFGNEQPEMSDAYYLYFVSSKEKMTRSMFMLLQDEYPNAMYPKGLVQINPSGKYVVKLSTTNVVGSNQAAIWVNSYCVPQLRKGDIIINEKDNKIYSVQNYTNITANDTIIHAQMLENTPPYELFYANVSGTVQEISEKYGPRIDKAAISTYQSFKWSYDYDQNLFSIPELSVDFKFHTYFESYFYASIDLGFLYLDAHIDTKVSIDSEFGLRVKMQKSINYNKEIFIASPGFGFLIGVLPVNFSMPIYGGVDVSLNTTGSVFSGYDLKFVAGAKLDVTVDIFNSKRNRFHFEPIFSLDFFATPLTAQFNGSVSVAPYIKAFPYIKVVGLAGLGISVKAYIEGALSGNIYFDPMVQSGSIAVTATVGVTGEGLFVLGIKELDLYREFSLGQLFNYRQELFRWEWSESLNNGISLLASIDFNISLKPGEGTVDLQWPSVNQAELYKVDIWLNNAIVNTIYTKALSLPTTSALVPGKQYEFTVSAMKNGLVMTPNPVKKPFTVPAPAIPVAVNATANQNGSIRVIWNPIVGAPNYNVYRTAPGESEKMVTTSHNYIDDIDVTTNKTYSYTVTLQNNFGESARSAQVSANVFVPTMPTGLTYTMPNTKCVDLDWNPVAGAVSYYIQRTTDGNRANLTEFFTSTDNFADETIGYNSTYYYKVYAKNYAAKSPMTAPISVATASTNRPMVEVSKPGHLGTISQSFMVKGTAKTGGTAASATVYMKIDSGVYKAYTVNADASWSAYMAKLTAGAHSIYYYTVDSANMYSVTNTKSFTVVAPQITITSPAVSSTNARSFTVSGTAVSGNTNAAVTVYIQLDTTSYFYSTTVAADKTWSYTFSGISKGNHTIYCYTADSGTNNSSTLSRSIIVHPRLNLDATLALAYPITGMDVDSSGNFWATGTGAIYKMDSWLNIYGTYGTGATYKGLAYSTLGYIVVGYSSDSGSTYRLRKFSTSTYSFYGTDISLTGYPLDLDIGSDYDTYVIVYKDSVCRYTYKYDYSSGAMEKEIGKQYGEALSVDGSIIVASSYYADWTNNVVYYDTSGNAIKRFNLNISWPTAVAADNDFVYVSTSTSTGVYDMSGTQLGSVNGGTFMKKYNNLLFVSDGTYLYRYSVVW